MPKEPTKPAKPGITSLSIGDEMEITIDTTLASRSDELAPATNTTASTVALTVTFLQSYEQVGMLQIECVEGCTCTETMIDTRAPSAQFALLSTSDVLVSQAHTCRLRLINVSPVSRAPGGTKIKISELGISTAT